jgi:hypothetical protein
MANAYAEPMIFIQVSITLYFSNPSPFSYSEDIRYSRGMRIGPEIKFPTFETIHPTYAFPPFPGVNLVIFRLSREKQDKRCRT